MNLQIFEQLFFKKSSLTNLGQQIWTNKSGHPIFTHKLAYVGKLAVSKDGKHFARALAYDGGLDFFRFYALYSEEQAVKFYALYSEEQAVNNPTRSANDICSFGLKGQALCHYTLDRKVEIIAVSPNDSVLYAIGNVIGQEESVYLFLYSL